MPSVNAPSTSAGAIATDLQRADDVGEPEPDELDASLLDGAKNEVTLLIHPHPLSQFSAYWLGRRRQCRPRMPRVQDWPHVRRAPDLSIRQLLRSRAEPLRRRRGTERPEARAHPALPERQAQGIKITGLTSYDQLTARIFDEAGIDFLLVGDSAGNNVFGYDTTLPVTVDELIPLTRAVAGAVKRAFVIADMPFGSYENGPDEALHTAIRFMKETGAHAVKLEGGERSAKQIRRIVRAGIPVMAHIGFTPQSEHGLGGHVIQGRGEGVQQLLADAQAVEEAGAFAVVLEMVPARCRAAGHRAARDPDDQRRRRARTPTASCSCGPTGRASRSGRMPKFVKQYAEPRGHPQRRPRRSGAPTSESGSYPNAEHSYE